MCIDVRARHLPDMMMMMMCIIDTLMMMMRWYHADEWRHTLFAVLIRWCITVVGTRCTLLVGLLRAVPLRYHCVMPVHTYLLISGICCCGMRCIACPAFLFARWMCLTVMPVVRLATIGGTLIIDLRWMVVVGWLRVCSFDDLLPLLVLLIDLSDYSPAIWFCYCCLPITPLGLRYTLHVMLRILRWCYARTRRTTRVWFIYRYDWYALRTFPHCAFTCAHHTLMTLRAYILWSSGDVVLRAVCRLPLPFY
jgi:hypothetical protein